MLPRRKYNRGSSHQYGVLFKFMTIVALLNVLEAAIPGLALRNYLYLIGED